MIHQPPSAKGCKGTRWCLAELRKAVSWLGRCSLPGIYRLLKRLGIHYKRGRVHVHSPDPDYASKMARITHLHLLQRMEPGRLVVLYEDELTYYRHPTVARNYAPCGSDQPHAHRGPRSNTPYRVAGCLNIATGRFHAWHRAHFDRFTLLNGFRGLETCYPQAERIVIVLDNWPVHFHDDLLNGLLDTKITLVPLPTYAPWTNPVEKVWRLLYQQVLHLHRLTDHFDDLKALVADFLAQFLKPSPSLLSYVGLSTY